VCRIFVGRAAQHAVHLRGEWRGESAAGCTLYAGCERNPQFGLRATEACACSLVLAQHDTRGSAESYHHIGLLVVDKGGERVRRVLRSEVIASSGKFVNLRQVSCDAVLEPGSTYTVFVSTYSPGGEAAFVLSVHSDRPVELFPMEQESSVQPPAGQRELQAIP